MTTTPLIIAGIVIAAVWAYYLIPSMVGQRREAPLSSTQQFHRLTRLMADVQRQQYDAYQASQKNIVRIRRRRTMLSLVVLAVTTLVLAWRLGSLNWLLVHLGMDVLIAWYVAMLWQLRQRQVLRAIDQYSDEVTEVWEDSPVRVIARR